MLVYSSTEVLFFNPRLKLIVGMAIKTTYSLKSLIFRLSRATALSLVFLLVSPALWAAQEAVVLADEALIYADEQMTSAVGYVSRGKKIKIGEIPRNKAQVYPIIVSGKIAYIKVADVSTQKEYLDSSKLVAERFQRQTMGNQIETSFSAAFLSYNSQIVTDTTNGGVDDKDAVNWTGVALRGNGIVNERWELQIITNYLSATDSDEDETFRMVEAGLGAGYRFLDWGRLGMRFEAHLLGVPWASYAYGDQFRVNGNGYTAGAGISLSLRLTQHWGIDGYGGVYYTKLQNFRAPEPFASITPVFYGTRLGAGIHYAF